MPSDCNTLIIKETTCMMEQILLQAIEVGGFH